MFLDSGEVALHVVVENEDEGRSDGSPDVGEVTLEESGYSFFGIDFSGAVNSALVLSGFGGLTGLHHKSSSDGVEREGNGFGGGDDELSEEESGEEVSLLLFLIGTEDPSLSGIVASEVESSVHKNAEN